MSLGKEAAINCLILPANIREVKIALLFLYDECLKTAFIHLNHEDRRVKLVYNKPTDESQGIFVLWIILVQLLFLHVFLNVVQ